MIDKTTGRIIGTEPFKCIEKPKWFSEDPARPLIDSLAHSLGMEKLEDPGIDVISTSKWILAFNQDANLLWKVAIPENWGRSLKSRILFGSRRPLEFYYGEDNTICTYAYFEKNIMGLDQITGKVLYKKTLPTSVAYIYFSGNGIVFLKLKDGHWYQFTPKDGEVVFIK